MKKEDFIRNRALTFSMVVVMIMRGQKVSLQSTINKVFTSLGKVWKAVSNSAYSQARKKLKAEVFVELNEVTIEGYYEEYGKEGEVKLWKGHRLLGVDGTYLNLPDTKETRKEYSIQSNQHRERVQALGSVLYDLRNDCAINAEIGKIQAEKKFIFEKHLAKTELKDIIVLDRAYADYAVMAMLISKQRDFVIRFPSKSFKLVEEFWQSDQSDEIISLKVTDKAKALVKAEKLDTEIRVRFIKVILENGEIEVLGTSLLDALKYPGVEFKQVYAWRWLQETYYGRIKNIFEIERFSGQSLLTIKQDFYGVIFLSTLESILSKPVQNRLSVIKDSNNLKNPISVNRSQSYVSLLDNVVELLINPNFSASETLAKLEFLFSTNPTRHAPARKFVRNKGRNFADKLFFLKYIKRICA